MEWAQACEFWDNGAISTSNLKDIAFDLFGDQPEALQDVMDDIRTLEVHSEFDERQERYGTLGLEDFAHNISKGT